MTLEKWQIYDSQGRPIRNGGALKHEVAFKGLLHSVAHLWIWRHAGEDIEVLVQKRAATKVNWPNLYDKSAGGHLFYGEDPLEGALRRAHDELGLRLNASQLQLAGVHRWYAELGNADLIENELQWLFIAELNDPVLEIDESEVQSAFWKPLQQLSTEVSSGRAATDYVPYGKVYYLMIVEALRLMRADQTAPARVV